MNSSICVIPSLDECRQLFDEYNMLPNIRDHSELVMAVTKRIVDTLAYDSPVNGPLCVAAALLHDIGKTPSLATRESHDRAGGAILRSRGYHSIAEIVEQHITLSSFSLCKPLGNAELVYYADKRVCHSRFVSVEERIADLLERYGTTDQQRIRILTMKDIVIDIEGKIERLLPIPVDALLQGL